MDEKRMNYNTVHIAKISKNYQNNHFWKCIFYIYLDESNDTHGFFLLFSGGGEGDRFLFLPGPPRFIIPLSWSPSVDPCKGDGNKYYLFILFSKLVCGFHSRETHIDIWFEGDNQKELYQEAKYEFLFFFLKIKKKMNEKKKIYFKNDYKRRR